MRKLMRCSSLRTRYLSGVGLAWSCFILPGRSCMSSKGMAPCVVCSPVNNVEFFIVLLRCGAAIEQFFTQLNSWFAYFAIPGAIKNRDDSVAVFYWAEQMRQ